MATLRLVEASKNAPSQGYVEEPATSSTGSRKIWQRPSEGVQTRQDILELLDETIRVQGIVQTEISQLARTIAAEAKERQEKQEAKEGKKKKKKTLSIPEAFRRVKELQLPIDPLEELNLTEQAFQKLLTQYEEDQEVSAKAQLLLHPEPKGDLAKARSISIEKIVEIHQFMVVEMQKVLTEFLALDQETRRSFSNKACETTAELLVSVAVEQQLGVHCEDVEQAVMQHEEVLANHPEFARCTEQLANMMQHLTGAAQPRANKADFLEVLRNMADHSQKAKDFAKKVYEEYRAKTCPVSDAYRRFEDFAAEAPPAKEGLEDLTPVELQLCYDEYREDPEVRSAWSKAGVENSLLMASCVTSLLKNDATTPLPEDKKGKKMKPSEIVEMQELMVDEMKRLSEASSAAAKASASPWRAETAMQMVQSLASAAVERRYGVSPEEMTIAGIQNAPALQKNERFVRATEKQHEIILAVAQFCAQ
ncbi:unnamed protein product [Symbiodinium natans]|uniref:Uncharacterized protein n=1 Tax=Symbiodinium natans TaxID=878477 RepID=A0A812LB01_9DINO|nr:unnamed protein product [Symbiodinium natans]